MNLAKHVFQHQETLEVVIELAKRIVSIILDDKETLDKVTEMLSKSLADERVINGSIFLVNEICKVMK